jgi:hypothetical protein
LPHPFPSAPLFSAPFAKREFILPHEGQFPHHTATFKGDQRVNSFTKDARDVARQRQLAGWRGKVLATAAATLALGFGFAGHALAAGASSPTGSLGEQLNTMSSEAINSGSTAFGGACYLAAALCFGFGVWALWQSRQPQNRETGHVGRGLAGLVLCGLFATAGVWINKAAITASGAGATINDTPAMVQFGTGG